MILLPILIPLSYPLNVGIDIVRGITTELDNNVFVVSLTSVVKNYLHDLCVEVFLELGLCWMLVYVRGVECRIAKEVEALVTNRSNFCSR